MLNFNNERQVIFNLPVLTQSDQEGNEHFAGGREEKRNKGEVPVAFFAIDEFEYSLTPTIEQLNALDYLQQHQNELLSSFFNYTKEVLYPTHIGYIGYDEISFPEMNSVEDLRKSLGLSEIYIWEEHKEGISYTAYLFDFTGDFEHGTILIAHKDRILGWEEDLVKDKILADNA